ncbi:aminoacyl-histidine dipeptidase [Methanolobus mangrovi]|uniref:Aminoacyl-histidine dipeptidase n=1 Tax=Methanolobus mangrovi TaxID=3072977 RepID=A0AA51UHT0_9EURY|nr:aminoacyl-histidine dipeptidase [Methanolobus mangrovi]WMW23124.1 aminoacyl-histidine dipeptidase [Methanolobus mangrovi]
MDEVTEKILTLFREISSVPRPSGQEERIATWLKEWGLSKGFSVKFDSVNNIVIGVPASKGYENLPSIVIQGHMDMVCEKACGSMHDFAKDPIVPVIETDWLRAEGTTLGADNGIALAIALALAEDMGVNHPPLELLFTVDEETGLTGANALMPDFITGKILLNVDSEEEGVFTVGCAGGLNTTIRMPLEYSSVPEDVLFFRLVVNGLSGGHSGVDIHEKRANANKLLAEVLQSLMEEYDLMLLDIKGGSAHNAIPRHAEAIIAFSPDLKETIISLIAGFESRFRSEYAGLEPSLSIALEESGTDVEMKAIDTSIARRVIGLLMSLPHGVASISPAIPSLVETSSNLAIVNIEDGKLVVVSSQRSSSDTGLAEITGKVESVAVEYGANCSHGSGYPAWQPDMSSPLLQRCMDVYSSVFGEHARIEAIHAGLECAVIGSKYEGMDMISFGPTIKNPHSPDERMYIPSVRKVWDLMVALLASFQDENSTRQGKQKKS